MEATELLTQQHRKVDTAFEELLSTDDRERRKNLARELIKDLSVHAGIEEVAFYPTVKDALPELTDEIDQDLEDHVEVKRLLAMIQGMRPEEPLFEPTIRQLMEDVREHVEEEEGELFPRVREALTEEERLELGQAMQDLESRVPTKPHPHQAQEPPVNKALGPVVGALDRLRDDIRERIDRKSV